jgi:predicted ATPase/class 3 adenylate cyclase
MPELPSGTVTLLFTDIEGSTRLLQHLGESYANVLVECRQLLRTAFTQYNGYEVGTQGDAFFVAFTRATDALWAAVAIQRVLARHPWPDGVAVRVRIGLHTGEPMRVSDGYIGVDVHHAACIMSAGHGGQILLSQTTRGLVEQNLPEGVYLQDLGEHTLKDLRRPSRLFQPVIAGLPADFPPLKTLDTHPNNLPVQPTPLIGREKEVSSVCEFLRREDVRLLTLIGTGGVGKTRLALQAAAELSDLYADGVYFVPLAPVSDPALVVPALAQILGVREADDQPLLNCLQSWLQKKQLLLLLDNFEQVVPAALNVAELLASSPKLKVLVTSRVALHLRAEREFAVPPMAVPDLKHLPELMALSQYEAVALFIQQAQAVKPDFQVTNTNAPAVAAICARLDGLPLAIELAAARSKYFSPETLLARLERRLSVLTGGARDLPARQQTLRNTIAWSYNLLDSHEQRLFRRLAVFAGGCTWEVAEQVCIAAGELDGDVLETLASLADKSLLRQEEQPDGEVRFRMLQTLREFGLEVLASEGELEPTLAAHAAYYLAQAEQAEPELRSAQQAVWLDRLEAEHDNLRAALHWLIEHKEAEMGLRLAGALWWFWCRRSYLSEGRTWLKNMLGLPGALELKQLRAKALTGASGLAWLQGDYLAACALSEESITLWRELGNKQDLALSLTILGLARRSQGDPRTAFSLAEESEVLFRQARDRWGLAFALFCQGNFAYGLRDYALARSLYERSFKLFQEVGDRWAQALPLSNLGAAAIAQGDYTEARPLLEEGVALFREQGDKRNLALWLDYLGQVIRRAGNERQAVALFEESFALYQELGHEQGMAQLYCTLGKMACDKGNYRQAVADLEASLSLMQEAKNNRGIAYALEGFARLATKQKQAILAAQLFGAAEALREALGAPLPVAERSEYNRNVADVRVQLIDTAFQEAWNEGRAIPFDHLIAVVLEQKA